MTSLREDPRTAGSHITIDRPAARNAIDPETAEALHDAIAAFRCGLSCERAGADGRERQFLFRRRQT